MAWEREDRSKAGLFFTPVTICDARMKCNLESGPKAGGKWRANKGGVTTVEQTSLVEITSAYNGRIDSDIHAGRGRSVHARR